MNILTQLKNKFFAYYCSISFLFIIPRELTKIYEETIRGELAEILDYFNNKKLKGEFVIVIEGNK